MTVRKGILRQGKHRNELDFGTKCSKVQGACLAAAGCVSFASAKWRKLIHACPQTISFPVCCKWFPQMENFSGRLKKYKVTINDLLAENEKLEARVKASEKGKMKDTMERARLESELHDIRRLAGRIPPLLL